MSFGGVRRGGPERPFWCPATFGAPLGALRSTLERSGRDLCDVLAPTTRDIDSGSLFDAILEPKWSPNGAKGGQKGANGSKMEPKGAKREPKGSQREPKGSNWDPK